MNNSKKAKRTTADQLSKLDARFKKVLNPKSTEFVDMNKTEFKEKFKGKLPFDLNQAWDWVVANK